jgi:hypothetical protein
MRCDVNVVDVDVNVVDVDVDVDAVEPGPVE